MQPSTQHSRVNLVELKVQIVKRIGAERSKLYFYYLNKFLSLKLSKAEFNKLCVRVIGKDNVLIHNQFIRSILKNACNATVPPPPPPSRDKEVPTSASDGSYSYPNGNADLASHLSTVTDDNIASEDGKQKLVQHHQEGEVFHHPAKLPLIKQSTDGLVSVHRKEQSEISEISTVTPLRAPLGIPFCTVSAGGSHRPLTLASKDRCASSYDSGGLLDTQTLRERMQQLATAHGLHDVSMDSASLLNSGLDAYLKRLVKSCIELINRERGCDYSTKSNSQKNHSESKHVNGFLPGHHFQVQSSNMILNGTQEQRSHFPISLLDFKVAMELNPQELGEDWPLLLEKICTHPSEE